MQCSGVPLISSRGPFCNLPLTHVNSFVAQFVYVQIGSHDGVVAGEATSQEARPPPDPITLTDTTKASSFSCAQQPLWVHLIWFERSEKAHEDKSQGRPNQPHRNHQQPRSMQTFWIREDINSKDFSFSSQSTLFLKMAYITTSSHLIKVVKKKRKHSAKTLPLFPCLFNGLKNLGLSWSGNRFI